MADAQQMANAPQTILVVDDEPSAFEVIEALLARERYDLISLPDGHAALDYFERLHETPETVVAPDVVLLDVMMPELDGYEVCRRLKANSHWSHIPIIMVTALHSKEDLARSLEVGADDFISKPVNGLELRARVRSMLRIKQQYDALEATLKLREDLSYMVVHDMRNPLTNILLCSQLLLTSQTLSDREKERIKLVRSSGKKLNSMIDELLILAKMESGKFVLNRHEVDLAQLVSYVLENFQAIARSKNINLVVNTPDEGRLTSVDVNLIQRLLENLLSNAIKFSETDSQITVELSYVAESSATLRSSASDATATNNSPAETLSHAVIQVADQGPGITVELRDRIFNKFDVGDVITGASQIGLGLTFCKLVTEAHGGRICVNENSPVGSIFTVEL